MRDRFARKFRYTPGTAICRSSLALAQNPQFSLHAGAGKRPGKTFGIPRRSVSQIAEAGSTGVFSGIFPAPGGRLFVGQAWRLPQVFHFPKKARTIRTRTRNQKGSIRFRTSSRCRITGRRWGQCCSHFPHFTQRPGLLDRPEAAAVLVTN